MLMSLKQRQNTLANPDLQIRGGGEGKRSSRPWDKGVAWPPKKFFRPFWPHFGLKIRRGGGGAGPTPGTTPPPPPPLDPPLKYNLGPSYIRWAVLAHTYIDKTRQCFIWSLIQSYVYRLYPNIYDTGLAQLMPCLLFKFSSRLYEEAG